MRQLGNSETTVHGEMAQGKTSYSTMQCPILSMSRGFQIAFKPEGNFIRMKKLHRIRRYVILHDAHADMEIFLEPRGNENGEAVE